MSNKNRKCKHCNAYKPAESGSKFPTGWFCSFDHACQFALEKSQRDSDRARARQAKKVAEGVKVKKREHQAQRMAAKPIGYWMKRAQAAFNAWVRQRDHGQPCISCDKPNNGQHQRHASHYRSVGASPANRFNELNVWASCSVCNNHLSGNLIPYRAALINKIGLAAVGQLEQEAEPKRYRKEDYQAIESEYKTKLKELLSAR